MRPDVTMTVLILAAAQNEESQRGSHQPYIFGVLVIYSEQNCSGQDAGSQESHAASTGTGLLRLGSNALSAPATLDIDGKVRIRGAQQC